MSERVEALLVELIHEVRLLRQAHERDDSPSTLNRADRDALARLLPAIAGTLGSDLFTARELIEHSAPALRLVCVGLSARQLGKLLRRAHGQPVGGYVVSSDGLEVGAVLWRVLATT